MWRRWCNLGRYLLVFTIYFCRILIFLTFFLSIYPYIKYNMENNTKRDNSVFSPTTIEIRFYNISVNYVQLEFEQFPNNY